MQHHFKSGDRIIFNAQKCGPRPSRSAKKVQPAPRGEDYHYCITKFWIVDDVLENGVVVVRTRTGKRREVQADDPRLRRANLGERFLYKARFPSDVGCTAR